MSYCSPHWISDYSFTKALLYRLNDSIPGVRRHLFFCGAALTRTTIRSSSLHSSSTRLPRFRCVRAYALSAGPLAAMNCSRSVSTCRRSPTAGRRPSSSRCPPALAGQAGWRASPSPGRRGGEPGRTDRAATTILRDSRTGRVRGILRDRSPGDVARISATLGRGLEVLFSRGVPDAAAWN